MVPPLAMLDVNVTLVLLQDVELAVAIVTTGVTEEITVTVTLVEVADTMLPQLLLPVTTQLNTSLLAIEEG